MIRHRDTLLASLAAILVIFTAMLDPRVSIALAVALLVVAISAGARR
jgi:hypothetical protein